MITGSTIFALSSGSLPSGVAVVRLSGPLSRQAIEALCGSCPAARQMARRDILADGELLDRGLVVYFPGPASFTGEDCAEFHLHGSRAVVAGLLAALGRLPGLRMAEAGEFTLRAFVNGKLDLTEAEALSDLIAAETEAQRRLALENAGGRQRAAFSSWRERLLKARALIEADIDFSDEEDVPGSVAERVWQEVGALAREMREQLKNVHAGEIVREGYRVALVGAPNAGKSSLLNWLAGRDVAIVSEEPGTTRDLIEVVLDLDGMKVVVIDTAGLRDTAGKVEAMGIERARRAAEQADVVLLLRDLAGGAEIEIAGAGDVIRVGTKLDLVADGGTGVDLAISTRTGAGIEALLAAISQRARQAVRSVWESALPTRQRHVGEIDAAISELGNALDGRLPVELRAESLRLAADHIGRLSGDIGAEEVLGEIFSRFCIGK